MFSNILSWIKGVCGRNSTIDEQEKQRLDDKLLLEELKKAFKKLKDEGHLK